MRILSLGNPFPSFNKLAVIPTNDGAELKPITNEFVSEGRWMIMFWWPFDFSALCPTELRSFKAYHERFEAMNTTIIGASTDSHEVHLAWRKHEEGLNDLPYALLSDFDKTLATELGILTPFGAAYRATFIVDPKGLIRWVSVNDLGIGRGVEEVYRVLSALQTGSMCPSDWKPGDVTL